ncbi:EamA family transporter [Gracilibacillus oryzae]|uniref:EamA family transporter n=1 Tax=Gracilibacillus oryzae TaxID=1672701 RepID=A0A7C8GRC0_9BACI|nr:DMT family transporter [Gracilibacillus oryzae]KAB8126279.1 EamA family transporter [Gracilibacillus oryzae]
MRNYSAYLLAIIGASFWGLTGIFVKSLYNHGFTAWEIVAIRLTCSTLILVILLSLFAPRYLKVNLKHLPYFFGLGVLGIVIFNWCYFTVMDQASLSIAVVLLYTSPIFVTILSSILFKEKVTKRKVLSLCLILFGCALAIQLIPIGNTVLSFQVILLGLLSAFFCALYSIIGKFVSQHYNFLTITVYALMMGSLFIFPTSSVWKKADIIQQGDVLNSIIGVSVISTIFAYLLYTFGLVSIESSKAAILGAMEPIVAVLVGVLIFRDSLTLLQITGITLVIFSAFVTVFQRKRKTGNIGRQFTN